jgi:hypothetical protein
MDTTAIISEAIRLAEAYGNSELSDKLRKLQNSSQMRPFGPNNYFYRNDNTDGPYCPVCWQRDRKEVLLPASKDYTTGHERHCQVCKTGFHEGPRKQPLPPTPKYRGDWPVR